MKKFTGVIVLAAACILGVFLYFGLNGIGSNSTNDTANTVTENDGNTETGSAVLADEKILDKRADSNEFAFSVAALTKEYDKDFDAEKAAQEPYYSRRLIVVGTEEIDLSSYGAERVIYGPDHISVLQFDTQEKAEAAQKELSELPQVSICEADGYADASGNESENTASAEGTEHMSWGAEVMGVDSYAESVGGKTDGEVVVAVVDTGVYAHSFLKDRLLDGIDYVDGDFDPVDDNGHGTHVSGTVVDCTPGLRVNVLPVRVLGANGKGSYFAIAMGIRYAADSGSEVINLSLGGSGEGVFMEEAVKYAISKGSTVVAAAGNENNKTEHYTPARMNECIVVAGVDKNMSRYTNSNYGESVDVTAPGVDVKSCVPKSIWGCVAGSVDGTALYTGTSMAAPHVSAIAAMMKLEDPTRTPEQIEQLIKDSAVDLGEEGWDPEFGYGIPYVGQEIASEETDDQVYAFDISVYDVVLEEYLQAAEQRFQMNLEAAEYVNSGTCNFSNSQQWNLVYQYIDLADDGEPELVVAIQDEYRPYTIMDIYGIRDGKPVRLNDNHNSIGYRSTYFICKDKSIEEYGSGGALDVFYTYYRVLPNSAEWNQEYAYVYNGWTEPPSYTVSDQNGTVTSLTEEEYFAQTSEEKRDYSIEWNLLYSYPDGI